MQLGLTTDEQLLWAVLIPKSSRLMPLNENNLRLVS